MVKQPVTVCYPQEKLAAPERLRGHIVNDMDVCICCGMCARRCPAGALTVDRKGGTWSIDPYACVVCGECIESCPKSFVQIVRNCLPHIRITCIVHIAVKRERIQLIH